MKLLLTALTIIILASANPVFAFFGSSSKKLTVNYPAVSNISRKNIFYCDSLLRAYILGNSPTNVGGDFKGIQADIAKGTDKFTIQINDSKTLSFTTGASIETGVAALYGSAKYAILRNDASELAAISLERLPSDSILTTLVINKKTGLAVWSKTRPASSLFYDNPSGEFHYLVCR